MYFANSRPDRHKRALRLSPELRPQVTSYTIPPAKPYELLTADEIYNGGDRTMIFDVESFKNYFLVSFKCWRTKKVIFFEDTPTETIDINLLGFVLHRFLCVGFNSKNYDIVVLALAMAGHRAASLFQATQEIIVENVQPYEMLMHYKVQALKINHIDIIEVCPLSASLKLYGGRLHCERMQDLPYKPHTELTPEQAFHVRGYNINDLDITGLVYEFQLPHIELREAIGATYGEDVRSRSDAQLAEVIIGGDLRKLGIKTKQPDVDPGHTFRYKVPAHIEFQTPLLRSMLERVAAMTFTVDMNGYVDAPPGAFDELRLTMGGCTYQMGMGGLHSTEESTSHVAGQGELLIDTDVASYYPRIILTEGLYPAHLGTPYLEAYGGIVERRLAAKAAKRMAEADGLKIAITGNFGKTGSQYSIVYSPENVVQICLSGQLNLLMLIEAIELIGIPVVSANTDGVVAKCPVDRYDDFIALVHAWERHTGFTTEETRYKGIYCRDVNNYIAVKEDGTCKLKGIYAERGSAQNSILSKNPECLIASDAVQAFLSAGTPIAHTVEACRDVRRFVSIRTVNGGAMKDGVYLGKAIRWYYAKGETGVIQRVATGHTVPKTEGARPCMDLPSCLPADLDLDYYTNLATSMLYDIGYYRKPKAATLF